MDVNYYRHFSYYYDEIMEDIHYNKWKDYLIKNVDKNKEILDLACGTGTLAIKLAEDGYKVEGLDLSETAIEVAKEKMKICHLWFNFYVGDMRGFDTGKKYDVISCFFDSVNFIEKDELYKVFETVYDNLNPGGLFIFDLFTLSAMKGFKHFTLKGDLVMGKYKWKMRVKKNTITHTISINDNGTKISESYNEHYYSPYELPIGNFKIKSITTDFKNTCDIDNDERILVVLEK